MRSKSTCEIFPLVAACSPHIKLYKMADSNNHEPPLHAAAASVDASSARRRRRSYAIDQLTCAFQFDAAAARLAVDACGPDDIAACCNYILDTVGASQDMGGPVTPIDSCPHVVGVVFDNASYEHLLPTDLQSSVCSYDATSTFAPTGALKATTDDHNACPSRHENWLCLTCGAIRCGRYVNGHALAHYQETNHAVHVSLADLSVWCHACQAYLNSHTIEVLQPIVQRLEELKFGSTTPQEEERMLKKARPSTDNGE
jgi:hypothetical protein